MLLSLAAPLAASAGEGSVMSGVVWADTNRDGVRQPTEVVQAGVTVELLLDPAVGVVAASVTAADGTYSFTDVPDGNFRLRVIAPGPYQFPDAVGVDNDFVSTGAPAPGSPETGISPVVTIAGATQATGIDAGLQPVADIVVTQLPRDNACQGLVNTGTPPFDATDGGGLDSSVSNCLVRTNDQTTQTYGVSLTGLPTGAQVDNVVADFTISSADGARFRFSGPGAGGLPTGCLVSGVTPPSTIVTNGDGSVTLRCNMGTFASDAKPITIPISPTNESVNDSHMRVTVSARAAQGGAGASNTVVGPDIQVTGLPRWDLSKTSYGSSTTVSTVTIGGVPGQQGYIVQYWVRIGPLGTKGVTGLTSPLTFTDRVIDYPGALSFGCRLANNGADGQGYTTPGSITCPAQGTPQGATGFQYTVQNQSATLSNGYILSFFIPLADAIRKVDPGWQEGDPIPTGTAPVSNNLINSQGWQDPQGNLNNGTGFEPGWDGTTASGNNVVVNTPLQVAEPVPGIPGSGKVYLSPLGGCCAPTAAAGNTVLTRVRLSTDGDTTVTNPTLVDVFDVSVWRIETLPTAPAGYVYEYAQGPNSTDLEAGPQQPNGQYPFDSSSLKDAATTANTTFPGPWVLDPTTFGANWQDTVNMVRLRPLVPTTVLGPSSTLDLVLLLRARAIYNGGPHGGETIPAGVQVPNEGGWTDPTNAANWSTGEAVLTFIPLSLAISKTPAQAQYLPGDSVLWTVRPFITAGGAGMVARQVVVTDTLPATLSYDPVCTQDGLPDGVTVSFNPQTRVLTFNYGDVTIGANLPTALPPLSVCTTVSPVAAPGSTIVNPAQVSSIDSTNAPTAQGSITINGTGQLAIQKFVDHSLVRPGDPFTWRLEWSNTTGNFNFSPTDVIDVLPWNGDGAPGSLSPRAQYDSDFTGTHGISAALAQPTYFAGQTGDVAGTWYYATAASATVNQDPRAAANLTPAPADPGGLWQTAAEIEAGAGFDSVTAVRFVAAGQLLSGDRVRAVITEATDPAVVNGEPVLNSVYVNRAQIFSATFPDQPLLSNEPYVLVPGWSIGDLVWRDDNGDGRFDAGEPGITGVPIELVDDTGVVVGTATTNADGRWIIEGVPEGTYTVRIPASAFAAGGVLEGYHVSTEGAVTDPALGETAGNKNTAAPDPADTGLTSSPVTFAYVVDANGFITGGNQPASGATDPGNLSNPMVPAGFKNLNMDLALAPTPEIDLEKSASPSDTASYTVGQEITYSFLVTNTGNTELTNVGVDEESFTGSGPMSAVTCPGGAPTVAAGATVTCTATYTITQADVDRGTLVNEATAHGTPPVGPDVVSPLRQVELIAPQDDDIDLLKSVTSPVGSVWAVGQVIEYAFLVTNTGNVTLTDIGVDDVQIAPAGSLTSGPDCPEPVLAPGDSQTCVATYTVTAADLTSGSINDRATAHGTPPNGRPVVVSPERLASVPVDMPALTVEKSATPSDAESFTLGQEITYSFLVTNTGNVPMTDVTVNEVSFDGAGTLSPIVCPAGAAVLAPQAQVTCTATYTVLQEDVDRGSLTNRANTVGDPPNGPPITSEEDVYVVPSDQRPAIALVKSVTAPVGALSAAGQVVEYAFRVTNTGNVTLHDVNVKEQSFNGSGTISAIVCPVTSLAPGEQATCTASYTATAADLALTQLTNTAVAGGTPPDGSGVVSEVVSLPSSAAVPIIAPPKSGVASTGVAYAGTLVAVAGGLAVLGLALVWYVRRRRGTMSE